MIRINKTNKKIATLLTTQFRRHPKSVTQFIRRHIFNSVDESVSDSPTYMIGENTIPNDSRRFEALEYIASLNGYESPMCFCCWAKDVTIAIDHILPVQEIKLLHPEWFKDKNGNNTRKGIWKTSSNLYTYILNSLDKDRVDYVVSHLRLLCNTCNAEVYQEGICNSSDKCNRPTGHYCIKSSRYLDRIYGGHSFGIPSLVKRNAQTKEQLRLNHNKVSKIWSDNNRERVNKNSREHYKNGIHRNQLGIPTGLTVPQYKRQWRLDNKDRINERTKEIRKSSDCLCGKPKFNPAVTVPLLRKTLSRRCIDCFRGWELRKQCLL